MLRPVDKMNDYETLGPDRTWLELSAVGMAEQYQTQAMPLFFIQKRPST